LALRVWSYRQKLKPFKTQWRPNESVYALGSGWTRERRRLVDIALATRSAIWDRHLLIWQSKKVLLFLANRWADTFEALAARGSKAGQILWFRLGTPESVSRLSIN